MCVFGLLTLTPVCSGEETIPAKKTKTLVSQMHQAEVEQVGHTSTIQRMETSFHTSTMMKVQVEEAELAHKALPRVLPKPTSKSPTPLVAKVAVGRQQSPSPVRHVKAPTPTPVR